MTKRCWITCVVGLSLWIPCKGLADVFHVTTAQELQTALTQAAGNGVMYPRRRSEKFSQRSEKLP